MAENLSEKPSENTLTPGPASSHGDSSDDAAAAKKAGITHNVLEKADSKVIVPDADKDDDPYKHLPADEVAILKQQVDTPNVKVGILTLYRYASRNDLLFMSVGAICAIAAGAALPLMTVIFGNLQGTFQR